MVLSGSRLNRRRRQVMDEVMSGQSRTKTKPRISRLTVEPKFQTQFELLDALGKEELLGNLGADELSDLIDEVVDWDLAHGELGSQLAEKALFECPVETTANGCSDSKQSVTHLEGQTDSMVGRVQSSSGSKLSVTAAVDAGQTWARTRWSI